MTTTSPLRPKLTKGAIVAYGFPDVIPTFVVFQINPEEMVRNIAPRATEGGGRGDAQRVNGAPAESLRMTLQLDAADQLERPGDNRIVAEQGLHPALAALEGLTYPPYPAVIANQALALSGSAFILGEQAPLAVLIWGPRRILPFRVASLAITEQFFDTRLNPIRATVALEARALSYHDLDITNPGYWLSLAAFTQKEVMAALNYALPATGPRPAPPI